MSGLARLRLGLSRIGAVSPQVSIGGTAGKPHSSLARSASLSALLLAALLLIQTGPAAAEAPLTVEIVTAHRAPVTVRVDLSGSIVAAESVPVSFRTGGRITEIRAEVGDSVTAGALLARVDATQAEAAARAAEAQLVAAEASLTQTQLARDRAADLLDRGAGTRADLDAAEQALLAARAARDQAQTQVAKTGQAVEDTAIRAPVSGIVTDRSGEPGQIASAAQAVLTLAPEGRREALFYAPNVPELGTFLNRAITVRPIDAPDQTLPATVTEISPLASVATGTVLVRARLEGAAANAGLGLPVSAAIALDEAPAIHLPWSALANLDGGAAVWTVNPQDQSVALKAVTVSRYTAEGIELSAGLDEGAQVVAAGSHLLFPGRKVRGAEEVKP